mmetsp:Transcript_72642/g.135729  ORF Transcript_72642/g.135729 Transcript_72642/m.135729 type:complete len:388 (+) Transcript_72642:53-1216(+)
MLLRSFHTGRRMACLRAISNVLCVVAILGLALWKRSTNFASPQDKQRPVCVTGANGYIGSWVTKELLDHGYTVHATVRKIDSDASKHLTVENLSPGTHAGKLKLFEADLLVDGSFDDAVKGCSTVFHAASPFSIRGKNDPDQAFVQPALKGTANVLHACTRAEVSRVVLTSSVAAVNGKTVQGKVYTEDDWNTESTMTKEPYSYSKTIAERRAWELAKDAPWDLRTINPVLVVGPLLSDLANEGSVEVMKNMITGPWTVGAEFLFGVVDVRDVAHAHRMAMEKDDARGRYLLSEGVYSIPELAEKLKQNKHADKFKLACSTATLPKPLLFALGWMLGLGWAQIRSIGWRYTVDGSKAKNEFGFEYRSADMMLNDMVDDMFARGMVEV